MVKWTLDALLGIGGMAAVYAATHRNQSRVALKVLHRELAANADIRDRFMREAYVANSVKHPGAVQVIDDYVSEEDEPFLVMELLDGQSLDVLQAGRGTLPVREVLEYADQLLDVLAAAHAKGIVHRDIKPQNIFVTTGGVIKVLDFGVARMLDGAASATATGSLLGTPAFMPPEQAGGRSSAICAASDLWSVGATMFTLLSGRYVHEAENAQAHTVRAAITPARSIQSVLPALSASLVKIIDRALAFEITERWQDAREMQEVLRRTLKIFLLNAAADESDDGEKDVATLTLDRGLMAAAFRMAIPKPARKENEETGNDTPPVGGDDVRALIASNVPPDDEMTAKAERPPPLAAPVAADTAPVPRPPPPPLPDATSVIFVPAPVFPNARASTPELLPAPPPPPPDSAPVSVRLAPADPVSRPFALAPTFGFQPPAIASLDLPGSVQTVPLMSVPQPPIARPPFDSRASYPELSAAPAVQDAISVSAQSISQATVPSKANRIRLGRAEAGAIAGAVVGVLIVAYLVVRAVFAGNSVGDAAPHAPAAPISSSVVAATAKPVRSAEVAPPATTSPSIALPSPTVSASTTAAPASTPMKTVVPKDPGLPAGSRGEPRRDATPFAPTGL